MWGGGDQYEKGSKICYLRFDDQFPKLLTFYLADTGDFMKKVLLATWALRGIDR